MAYPRCVVHLRIVTPPEQAGAVIELLDACASVINVIRLPAAARKPDGDVILADVAREDTSVVLADLRRLGLHHTGSIAIDQIDTMLSDAAVAAERAAVGSPADAVVWEELTERTSESAELSASFLAFMVIATLIASIGVMLDSAVLIVGAMVVGPEFGPIAGFCVAAVQRRPALAVRSFTALAVGFPLGILAALALTVLAKEVGLGPETFSEADHGLARTIASPDWYAVAIGLFAGAAGMLSLSTSKSGALIGVLISVTTIPAAANTAVAAAYSDWSSFRGSLGTLGLNLLAILVSGLLVLSLQRLAYARRSRAHHRSLDAVVHAAESPAGPDGVGAAGADGPGGAGGRARPSSPATTRRRSSSGRGSRPPS
jgi:uncharacterized hydrophobic protein (TIGR00271 family)